MARRRGALTTEPKRAKALPAASSAPRRATIAQNTPRQAQAQTPTKRAADAPARRVETPARRVEAPVKRAETPVKRTEVPARRTEAPARKVEPPVRKVEPPVRRVEPPARRIEPPARRIEPPAKRASVNRAPTAPAQQRTQRGTATPPPRKQTTAPPAPRRDQQTKKKEAPPATRNNVQAPAKKNSVAKAPPAKAGNARDPRELSRYKRNQEILKTAQPGTPEYDKAVKGLERVGTMYGLNWKQHIPGGYQDPAAPPAPAPSPQPAPNVPSTVVAPPAVTKPSTANPLVGQPSTPNPAMTPPPAAPGAPGAPAPNMNSMGTLEGQDALASSYGVNLYEQMLGQSRQFNPQTFQQNYAPQFQQGMQQAYDNVYNEFERRNSQRMGQEQQQLEQSIVERGLDPSGQAAQDLRMQLSQRQGDERQGAQNAAWQNAQAYQQQGFNQAQTASLMPGEIWQQYQNPYMQMQAQRGAAGQSFQDYGQAANLADMDLRGRFGLGAQSFEQAQALAAQEAQTQERLLRLGIKGDLQKIRATPRGGGGGGMDPYAAWEANYLGNQIAGGYPQQQGGGGVGNAAISGLTQGVGGALVNSLNKRQGQ